MKRYWYQYPNKPVMEITKEGELWYISLPGAYFDLKVTIEEAIADLREAGAKVWEEPKIKNKKS